MNRSREIKKRLNTKDPVVRHFLRHPCEGKRMVEIPERFLGKNEHGMVRSQREARQVGSKVRLVLKELQDEEDAAVKDALRDIKSFKATERKKEEQPYTVLKDYINEHKKNERIALLMKCNKRLKEDRNRVRVLKPFNAR